MRKATRQLVAKLEAMGWVVSFTNGGHLRAVHPQVPEPMVLASTASDHRSHANTLARAARMLRQATETTPPTEPEEPMMYTYARTGRVSKIWQVTPTGVLCLECGKTQEGPLRGIHLHEDWHAGLLSTRAKASHAAREAEATVEAADTVVVHVDNDTVRLQQAYDLLGSVLQVSDQSARIAALEAEVTELRTVLALSREALDMLKGINDAATR